MVLLLTIHVITSAPASAERKPSGMNNPTVRTRVHLDVPALSQAVERNKRSLRGHVSYPTFRKVNVSEEFMYGASC